MKSCRIKKVSKKKEDWEELYGCSFRDNVSRLNSVRDTKEEIYEEARELLLEEAAEGAEEIIIYKLVPIAVLKLNVETIIHPKTE